MLVSALCFFPSNVLLHSHRYPSQRSLQAFQFMVSLQTPQMGFGAISFSSFSQLNVKSLAHVQTMQSNQLAHQTFFSELPNTLLKWCFQNSAKSRFSVSRLELICQTKSIAILLFYQTALTQTRSAVNSFVFANMKLEENLQLNLLFIFGLFFALCLECFV